MKEVGSIARMARILGLFTQGYYEISPTEVAQKLNMNKSTVIRLMNSLVSTGFLSKTTKRGKYCLGVQIINLARASLLNPDLETVCQPYLHNLRDLTGETISLDVREGDERVCLLIIEGNQPVRLGAKFNGEHATLHAGSDSKILLAFLPDEEIESIINRYGLTRYTNSTITNKEDLMKEIEAIRKNDFSISREERWEYAYCISAPIRNYTGMVIAAISVYGIVMRLTPELEKEYVKKVKKTATEISRQLGYWDKAIKNIDYSGKK